MNYEQRYKEVLEQAKQAIENIPDKSLVSWLENIFPELHESEDERIRKELIHFFNQRDEFSKSEPFNGLSNKKIIAWLEKQGEQKAAEWNEKDKKYIAHIMAILEGWDREHVSLIPSVVPKCIDWLKSLKPQNRWKPSGKQMSVLQIAIKDYGICAEKNVLESLYNDLKLL